MQPEEFTLVRDALRTCATRHRVDTADADGPDARAAARRALDQLGLAELRRSAPPAATAQECALLAEDHGAQPLTTSLLGTALLAPELLRLLDAPDSATRPALALAADLRFPGAHPHALVAWDCDGADSALWVAADGAVRRVGLGRPVPTADPLRDVRTVPDDDGTFLGRLDPDALRRWQAHALVMVAAELTGAATAFLELSTDYARDRRQYGRPIGSFQAVQHLLADALVLAEGCASATRYAAWCLDHEPPDRALTAARIAKAEVNTSAVEAVYAGMQVFGGIAQTWEHVAHLYLRRVLMGARLLATTADLLPLLADDVAPAPAGVPLAAVAAEEEAAS
ncbi:acyl-CoA dehydrogenase family protein [Streptomyces sp. JW3]|uniref:acyl-CoA dehydrogenase family protein n=1 Tax=Streptomyces sp. JW3 TaxID=3456955 RepID=UPI003FA49CA0